MLYVSAYSSRSLDDNSECRFKESGITYITITETDEDISDALSFQKNLSDDGHSYPNWHELALCLRTDWTRLTCLPVEEGETLRAPLKAAFRKYFDSPELDLTICNTLTNYAVYMQQHFDGYRCNDQRLESLYCLNKHAYFTLKSAFEVVGQGNDEDGLSHFRQALIVGSVKNAIEVVVWNLYH